MKPFQKRIARMTLGTTLFISGVAAGTLHEENRSADSRFHYTPHDADVIGGDGRAL